MSKPNLEQYLTKNYNKDVIDHSIRAHVELDGSVTFYIHPTNADGDTLDFKVEGNNLIQKYL